MISAAEIERISMQGEISDRAAIVPRAARLDEIKPGARKECVRVLLQASFRGAPQLMSEACSCIAPARREPFDPHRKPDRWNGCARSQPTEKAVIASAGHKLAGRRRARIVQFEDKAGVVIGSMRRTQSKADARDIERRAPKCGAALELRSKSRRSRSSFASLSKPRAARPPLHPRPPSIARSSRSAREVAATAATSARQRSQPVRGSGPQSSPTERPPKYAVIPAIEQQVRDQQMRRLRIGACERRQHALIFRSVRAMHADARVDRDPCAERTLVVENPLDGPPASRQARRSSAAISCTQRARHRRPRISGHGRAPSPRGCIEAQREHLRVRRRDIGAAEGFDASLDEFGRPIGAVTKIWSEIAEAVRPACNR